MNVTEFFEQNKIGGELESFPEGDTYLDLKKIDIEPIQIEFDGKQKTRYKIQSDEKTYVTGITVLKGIKEAKEKQKQYVRITRTGEGMETTYTVITLDKIPQ